MHIRFLLAIGATTFLVSANSAPASAHVPPKCLKHNAIMESFLAAKKSSAEQFETAPHGGIRNQIKEALEGGAETPNMDPKMGWDRRYAALTALDGFTFAYIKLDLRHMSAFSDYLRCIAK